MKEFLKKYKPLVDDRIQKSLISEQSQLQNRCQDYIVRGGKRIRPFLVFLGAMEGGKKPEDAVGVGASIEILHNFTLIHDDIEDDSDYRRGEPVLHKSHGVPLAINTGDAMFAKSFELISEVDNILANRFARTVWNIASGQDLDILWSNSSNFPSEDEYISMVRKKTAELIGFSLDAGYYVAKKEFNSGLYEFGINLGIAFQIIDDVLGVVGDSESTGKDVDKDILEGKRSLPIINAIEMSDKGEKIKEIIQKKNKTKEDIDFVKNKIKESHTDSYCKTLAKKFIDKESYKFENKKVKRLIEELKEFLINRKY